MTASVSSCTSSIPAAGQTAHVRRRRREPDADDGPEHFNSRCRRGPSQIQRRSSCARRKLNRTLTGIVFLRRYRNHRRSRARDRDSSPTLACTDIVAPPQITTNGRAQGGSRLKISHDRHSDRTRSTAPCPHQQHSSGWPRRIHGPTPSSGPGVLAAACCPRATGARPARRRWASPAPVRTSTRQRRWWILCPDEHTRRRDGEPAQCPNRTSTRHAAGGLQTPPCAQPPRPPLISVAATTGHRANLSILAGRRARRTPQRAALAADARALRSELAAAAGQTPSARTRCR